MEIGRGCNKRAGLRREAIQQFCSSEKCGRTMNRVYPAMPSPPKKIPPCNKLEHRSTIAGGTVRNIACCSECVGLTFIKDNNLRTFSKNPILLVLCSAAHGFGGQTPENPLHNLPLRFVANQGQFDSRVLFSTDSLGSRVFLTREGATFAIGAGDKRSALRMSVAGVSPNARWEGERELDSISNYLRGADRRNWVVGARQFGAVRAKDVRPGVDMVYYATGKELEYDVVLHHGARPEDLRFRFDGADRINVSSAGDLVIKTGAGEMIQHKPGVWQESARGRTRILAQYRLESKTVVSIRLGKYDRQRDLTVDPVVAFSTYLGGQADDSANAVALDAAGNIYVAGYTTSTDFPTSVGSYRVALKGTSDAFVTKLNRTGTAILYSTLIGGSSGDGAQGIGVDSSGNAYIFGNTSSSDFPTTAGSLAPSQVSAKMFVTKLNGSGTGLIYSTYLGGSAGGFNADFAVAIAVDTSGAAYLTGYSYGGFPVTPGAFESQYHFSPAPGPGGADVFVAKLSTAGDRLLYGTYLGGFGHDQSTSIAIDSNGQAYVTGSTTSSDFPTTAGAFQTANRAPNDLSGTSFVTCLNAQGTALTYSTYFGGSSGSNAGGIALDGNRNAYIVGETSATDFPVTAGSYLTSLPNRGHGFLSKLNPSGSALIYSTLLGGSGYDGIGTVAVDNSGSVAVTGITTSVDFPLTVGALTATPPRLTGSGSAFFLTKFSPSGDALVYSTFLGSRPLSRSYSSIYGVALDSAGNPVIVGNTLSASFPTSTGSLQPLNPDRSNYLTAGSGFVTQLDLGSSTICSLSLSASSIVIPRAGSSGTISVTAPAGCPWEADATAVPNNNNLLITLGLPHSGIGSGSFTYTVTANSAHASTAFGALAIGGISVPFAQAGYSIPGPAKVGVMQPSFSRWVVDSDGGGAFDVFDRVFSFQASAGDIAVVGDWTGDGHVKAGIYRNGFWLLDLNNNGLWDGPSVDGLIAFGGQPGAVPIVGDWNGDGRAKAGIYLNGFWILDTNGNGVFDSGDQFIGFGGNAGEQPVLGDWNGDGRTKVGILNKGLWALDYNGNGVSDSGDKFYNFPYVAGDKAVVGDWNGTHTTKIGIYRAGFWILDYNGNGVWDGPAGGDRLSGFGGNPGEIPVVGDWNGSGTTKIGYYYRGFWALDYNGSGVFDSNDRFFGFGGAAGEQPIVGAW